MVKTICEVCQILICINKEKRIFIFGRIVARIKSENILKQCAKHKDEIKNED